MNAAALKLHKESGAVITYVQSDEITCVLTPYKKFESEAWFGGEVLKLCSAGASTVSTAFNLEAMTSNPRLQGATFDCRAFVVPREEVENVLVDRQRDCQRNAIQGQTQAVFSHKELFKKSCADMLSMLAEKGNYPLLKDQAFMNGRMVLSYGAFLPNEVFPAWDFGIPEGRKLVNAIVNPADEEK